ncbi:hypothetical protein [Hymenobacter guriensis]|uniref:HEAT repeat domain-containing protein n=1 Tax=Hymenobacter guriensis TaxID=2793065 RepID=A0ABS0KWN6_9BACT|nr:hypothetical protein [Hymenobacter guriensis]MBG8552271.1 hypothetical protein [Hymenobacter guriensis]
MFIKLSLLIVLSFHFVQAAQGQTASIRPEVLRLTEAMTLDSTLDVKPVGRAPRATPAYHRFVQLGELATMSELSALTSHPKPIVRSAAFLHLVRTAQPVDILPLLAKHTQDTVAFTLRGGCITSSNWVGHFMYLYTRQTWKKRQLLAQNERRLDKISDELLRP